MDQAIEQTVNQDTKTEGELIGFSQKPGSVERWIINAHQLAEITRNCASMASANGDTHVHKECQTARRAKDEKAVQAVLTVLSG